MWTEILKSLPRDRSGLIEMLKDDVAFRRLIRTLGRRELRGNHFIKDFLRQIDDMEKSGQLDTFLTVMQNTPPTGYPLEKLKENLATLRKTISYEADDLKIQIIDEGLALLDKKERSGLTDAEKDRLNELHTRISTMTTPKGDKYRRTARDFNAKKKTFLRDFGGFSLNFSPSKERLENLGRDDLTLSDFESKIDEFAAKTYEIRQGQGEINVGTRSGKTLTTNFLDGKEFLDFFRKNEQFKEDFNELARPFGPDLSGIGIKVREDDAKTKLQALHARKVVFKAAEIDTITEVNNYFDVIAGLPGAKGVFMPRKVETTVKTDKGITGFIDVLPPSLFLLKNDANSIKSRSSISQLRLNPYANKILLSGFSKTDWFEKLFEGVKMEITSESKAMNAIYDDIFRIYQGGESELKLNPRDFAGLENLSSNARTRRNQIKRYIERNELTGDLRGKAQELRLSRFNEDTETLTVEEGKRLQKILDDYRKKENLDQDEFDEIFGKIRLIALNAAGEESMPVKISEDKTITPTARYSITLAEFDDDTETFEEEEQIKIGSLIEYLEDLGEIEISGFSGQISRIRDFLGRENNFQNYMGSLSPDEIRRATEMATGTQAFMDRIDPLNSLAFLSNLNELMGGYPNAGFVKETLLAIADEEEPSDKAALIEDLNTKMLPILKDMREFMFKAVQDRLETIGKDYLKLARGRQEKAILQAIEGFKENRLLTGGE